MKIDAFGKGLNQKWLDALFDNTIIVFQLTLISKDEDHLLGVANGIIENLGKLKTTTIRYDFLGASRIGEGFFPQLGFACKAHDDVLKMHGAVSGYFAGPVNCGYNIQYAEVK